MSKKIFKVMESMSKEELLREKYNQAFKKLSEKIDSGILTKEDIKKLVFYGVKYIGLCQYRECYVLAEMKPALLAKELKEALKLIENVTNMMGSFTLKELTHMYPVSKTYGRRELCDKSYFSTYDKDYFSTIETIAQYDQNIPLGRERLLGLLWSYKNYDLSRFLSMKYMVEYLVTKDGKEFIESCARENARYNYAEEDEEEIAIKRNRNFRNINFRVVIGGAI